MLSSSSFFQHEEVGACERITRSQPVASAFGGSSGREPLSDLQSSSHLRARRFGDEVAELTFVRINDLAAPVEKMSFLM